MLWSLAGQYCAELFSLRVQKWCSLPAAVPSAFGCLCSLAVSPYFSPPFLARAVPWYIYHHGNAYSPRTLGVDAVLYSYG